MIITSLNGKRAIAVARKTRDRVIHHLISHPRKTVVEYSHETLVAQSTINLIIGRCLLDRAAAGEFAVSYRGRKPDWFFLVPDASVVPVRPSVLKRTKPALPGITDRQLRLDYSGLATQYHAATAHSMSPAKRHRAQHEFAARLSHIGGAHQDTIDRTSSEIMRLQDELHGLREAVQLLATVVTNGAVKVPA